MGGREYCVAQKAAERDCKAGDVNQYMLARFEERYRTVEERFNKEYEITNNKK